MTTEAMAPPRTKSQVLRSYDVADFPALRGLEEEWHEAGSALRDALACLACPFQMPRGSPVGSLTDAFVASVCALSVMARFRRARCRSPDEAFR